MARVFYPGWYELEYFYSKLFSVEWHLLATGASNNCTANNKIVGAISVSLPELIISFR